MKLFWKIFFTAMFICMLCVTFSSYIIIESGFSAQLKSETDTAIAYGEIVFYSLESELKREQTETEPEKLLARTAQSVSINSMNQRIEFSIINDKHETVCSSLSVGLDKDILLKLGENEAGWVLKEIKDSMYVQTVRPVVFSGERFYIETVKNVTHIFENQQRQYMTMIKVTAVMMIVAGVLTFILSKLLLSRVKQLTQVTKYIAEGDLGRRTDGRGEDEIALLSRNFNLMADSLEKKIHELKEEARRKELFVGAFSHELKTPMTSVIGYADLLRQRELTDKQRRMCADYIFTQGKRLESLSMRLLQLIVLRNREINRSLCDVRAVISQAARIISPKLGEISLDISLEQANIYMEADLMETVFLNLLDNARKAIKDEGVITVTGRHEGENYTITVRDTGCGMKKEELKRITEAFYMPDSSRASGGAGLGLAICSEILTAHGFDIAFESVEKQGTAVTVTMKGVER